MCESNVYMLDENGVEQLVMESVDKIVPSETGILLESIFSEKRELKAAIKEMALVDHKIILRALDA